MQALAQGTDPAFQRVFAAVGGKIKRFCGFLTVGENFFKPGILLVQLALCRGNC